MPPLANRPVRRRPVRFRPGPRRVETGGIVNCSFSPDGKLYVVVADGPDPAVAQDDKTPGGKAPRLNPDGSAPWLGRQQ